MTRQYIGARYVPKFYDYNGSSNWRSGVEYEALTIVTRNGNSYTSKIPVPSSVGSPEENPTYWVATGLYNEQVEAYRQLTLALASRVDDVEGDVGALETTVEDHGTRLTTAEGDIDNLENATDGLGTRLTTAEGDIDNLETGVSNLRTQLGRKIVFLGDSYNTDLHYNWSKKLMTKMGLTENVDAWTLGMPGGSFGGGTGFAFSEGLATLRGMMTQDQANSVTDVVIQGDVNDYQNSFSDVAAGVTACETYVTNNFPNARLWIACVGWSYENDTIRTGTIQAYNWIYNIAKRSTILRRGFTALLSPYSFTSDMTHPTVTTADRIAATICDFINGGELNYYDYSDLNATFGGMTILGNVTPYGLHIYHNGYAGINLATPVNLTAAANVVISTHEGIANQNLFMRDCTLLGSGTFMTSGGTFHNLPCVFRVVKRSNAMTWDLMCGLRGVPSGGNDFVLNGVSRIYPVFDCFVDYWRN